METKTLNIAGMSCDACVRAVTRALVALDGVESAQASLARKQATVTYEAGKVREGQMTDAIAEEGYEATPQE